MPFEPVTVAFLVLLAGNVGLRWWLSRRQERHVLAHRDTVPEPFDVPLEAHEKAADYTAARARFGRTALVVDAAFLLAFTLGGGLRSLAEWTGTGTLAAGTLFALAAFAARGAVGLALRAWRTFSIERRFGFNRTTPALFLIDLAKEALLGVLIGAPLVYAALWLADRGWWLRLWVGWLAVTSFFAWVWPTWIAPLFWRFRPLSDRELADRLEALLERNGFAASGLYEMDGSRRSAKANAFFAGFGRRKRVVLFDTLLELLTPEEIEAVLAHELGHDKRRHVLKGLGLGAAVGALFLAGLAGALAWPPFCTGLNVPDALAPGFVLFAWVAPLVLLPLRPLLSAWSRHHEYEADAFATEQVGAQPMEGALVKLYRHNASTLTPDPVHSAFYDSHPPAPLRVGRLRDSG